MSTFEALSLMFGFSMVLLTLLSVIVSITKNGKK
ncbi:holin-like toxin [Ruminiclostridium papyrosolvens DSM 2782]|uniref:Holin-like toxin n=1 Tax=Ruminiclostridium papyrosolvens DSM 2782 TaxID=588581 RepID=F1TH14_9FIRM|nr:MULTISPECIES: putative holin-like toxin [Ruminiclostridium]EGD46254.1 holin-like toxin [Ruminiclostridium papyrosolvens DSM 2782]WES33024.1 putative holin-like toxin [Ruminiclostridium papyrosolvens DSM 2782]